MAWDEWEQLKADALARRQEGMRLDSAAVAGGGGGGTGDSADLKTNKSGKKAAVKSLRDEIRPESDTAGSHADESSSATVREFSGWATGSGLKAAHEEWDLQVKSLKGRLGEDQTALEKTHQDFQYLDLGIGGQIVQIDTGHETRREG